MEQTDKRIALEAEREIFRHRVSSHSNPLSTRLEGSYKLWHSPEEKPKPHGGLLHDASPTILCLLRPGMNEFMTGQYLPDRDEVKELPGHKSWVYWSDVVSWCYSYDLHAEIYRARLSEIDLQLSQIKANSFHE